MKTKDKIVSKALKLFNEKGYNNITTRHIAAELNISPGNLHYHFKHSEDIIKQLFLELISQMDQMMTDLKKNESKDLESLYNFTYATFGIFYSYQFIFLNFLDILNKLPEIEAQYEILNIRRKEEFNIIFEGFQKNAIFRTDIPDFIMDHLLTQMFIFGNSWILHNKITLQLNKEEAVKHYTLVQMNLFYPLLNDEQQKLYESKYIR
ncbi:TetR/AcrR family transcriptional regulator [Chryseobacterium polytrichastri]|uniref:Transcriptional regulator, TetR family n=1 Tax=Chryseobacterium polytrichastri TaxID=1302687 RepID=A0A1M6UD74_9FLAO|nr:TetR/AcrR family transcriptional regulator [Chryseobacterium polytrichastri]SHK67123.1 transcriptional regulator, TetR family [Chryseobacterium polytrichastri]